MHGEDQSLVYNEYGLIHDMKEVPLDSFMKKSFQLELYQQYRNQCLQDNCTQDSEARANLSRFFYETKFSSSEKNYIIRDLFYFAIKYQDEVELVEATEKADHADLKLGDKSKELLSIIYEFKPDDEEILYQYAFSTMKAGDGKEALPLIQKLYTQTKVQKQKVNYGLILVNLYESEEMFTEAKKVYAQLRKSDTNNPELCYRWAKSIQKIEGTNSAVSSFQSCKKSYSDSLAQYYFTLGRLHLEGDQVSKARDSFDQSFIHDKNYGPAILAKAIIAEEQGKIKEAINYNEKYLLLNPSDFKTVTKLTDLYVLNKENEKAITVLSNVMSKNKLDSSLVRKYVVLLFDQKKYREVTTFLSDYLEKNKIVDLDLNDQYMAIMYSSFQYLNENKLGVKYLKKINPQGNLFQFSVLSQLEYYREAGIKFRSEKDQKNLADIREDLEVLYQQTKLNNKEEYQFFGSLARSFKFDFENNFEQAISFLAPWQDNELFAPQYIYYVSELYMKLKDIKGMESYLKKHLSKNEKDYQAWNFLGYTLLDQNRPDLENAEKYLSKAYSLAPQDPYVLDSYAWLLYHKKDYLKAIKFLNMAIKKAPHEWEMVKHLAHIHHVNGETELANKILSQFAQSAAGRAMNKEVEALINSWASIPQDQRSPSSDIDSERDSR